MKIGILIFSILFCVTGIAQEKQYLLQSDADSIRKEVAKAQNILRSHEIIPQDVYNPKLTKKQNIEIYALQGEDSVLILDSSYLKYNGFYLEKWHIQKWGRYDIRVGPVGKNVVLPTEPILIQSEIAWLETIITFYLVFRNKTFLLQLLRGFPLRML